jgi:hypothetical protein
VKNQDIDKFVPMEYHENALSLMVQSPTVLYAYWELSPGLKKMLSGKKKVQIRLNIEGNGVGQTYDIGLSEKSYYFKQVQPGLSYNCELGTLDSDNIFLPLLRSNAVNTSNVLPGAAGSKTFSSHVFHRDHD